jgi:Dolichyl-phosphate-mannose-protein mannosyltransferase
VAHTSSKQVLSFRWFWFFVVVLLVTFVALSSSSVCQKAATYDETPYIGAGNYLIKTHRFDEVAQRHPVFWTIWHDLPLLFLVNIPDDVWKEKSPILRGQRIIALRSDDLLLNFCRLSLLPFGVGLGLVICRWSRQLYGDVGAILSLTLYSFCPNFLGHASLLTPDVMFSCFAVLAAWRMWSLANKSGVRNSIYAAVALSGMLLSKHTGLLIAATLFVADIGYRVTNHRINCKSWRSIWAGSRHWLILAVIASLVVWGAYGFQISEMAWPSGVRSSMPAAHFFEGVLHQYLESRKPQLLFLMGLNSSSGWWYYYVVVCLIKIPAGILILLGMLVFILRRLRINFCADELYLIVPFAMVFAYLSLFNTLEIGFRYLLPVYPLLLILLGKYAEALRRSLLARVGAVLLMLWTVASSLSTWPNYISYCNELIGGPRQGYHWLGDSNIDWGQDLKELKRFMTENGISRVQLAYFGTADPAHYGIDYEYLPSPNTRLRVSRPLPPGETPSRFLAISTYNYQGIAFRVDSGEQNPYRSLYRYVPNHFVGYSILIFDTKSLRLRTNRSLPLLFRQFLGLEDTHANLDSYP